METKANEKAEGSESGGRESLGRVLSPCRLFLRALPIQERHGNPDKS